MRVAYRVVSVALVLVSSCAGDETATGPGPIPLDRIRAFSVAANCDFLVRCGFEPDVMTCRRVDGADDELLQLIADARIGKVKYDAAAALVWIGALSSRTCAIHGPAADENLADAWKPVFVGTIAEGGACYVDDECKNGLVCDRSACTDGTECCAGKCVGAPAPIAEGEACDIGSTPCVAGSHCGPAGPGTSDHQCVVAADPGKPCTMFAGCKDNQLCDQDMTGMCYALATSGQSCDPTHPVACAAYTELCSPKNVCASLPRDGEPCNVDGPGCLSYAVCVEGTCVRRPALGEACDMLPCLGDLDCDNGICSTRTLHVCTGG